MEDIVVAERLNTVVCLYAHEATLPIHILDLTQNGRWDLICRCLVASLMRSCGVRRDVEFRVLLKPLKKLMRVDGSNVWHLKCDERNTGYTVLRAMKGLVWFGLVWFFHIHPFPLNYFIEGETSVEQKCLRGWSVNDSGEADGSLLGGAELVLWLCEDGDEPLDMMEFLVPLCKQYGTIHILVGDKQDISEDEMKLLKGESTRCIRWSLGKLPLLASQCITIALYFLDRARQRAD